jgi:prevent-host-death family protein
MRPLESRKVRDSLTGMEKGQVSSDEARRSFRKLLNAVEHNGEHVTVLRYSMPAAVVVPVGWYEQAKQALSEETA